MKKALTITILIMLLSSCGNNTTRTAERLGEEVFTYYGMQIPVALGEPQLDEEYYKEKKNHSAYHFKDEINTYADALALFKNSAIDYSDEEFIEYFKTILDKDYEAIENVYVTIEGETTSVFSIKTNDRYYLLDPLSNYHGDNEWLQGYNLDKGSFDSREELLDALSGGYPKSDVAKVFYTPLDPDGRELKLVYEDKELAYRYKGWDYLLAYGLPVLNDNEINELISEAEKGNYDEIRDRITTVPDMMWFLRSKSFKSAGKDSIVSTDAYSGGDVGNIRYQGDNLAYTISGKESLMVNEGQCSSTATLLHYLLADDYEEVGYVPITFVSIDDGNLDGHVINYIKNNNKYYLISPSYYLAGDNAWMAFSYLRSGCSTLEEAMGYLLGSNYPNGKVISTAAFAYDGIYACFDKREKDRVSKRFFPEGADVKVCLGSDYEFLTPKHPTDQDYVIGVTIK